jgi:hypothetical protein
VSPPLGPIRAPTATNTFGQLSLHSVAHCTRLVITSYMKLNRSLILSIKPIWETISMPLLF